MSGVLRSDTGTDGGENSLRGRDEKRPNVWELHVQRAYRGRDEKRPNVWELHVQRAYRGRDEKHPNVWELHVRGLQGEG